MSENDPKTKRRPVRLMTAKKVRAAKLEALRILVEKCNCTWPLDTLRNGSGHDSACPAHADYLRRHDDDDIDAWDVD